MSESEQGGAGRREVAYRMFAAEYEDADRSYSESDEERAPNYVITPSGARVNRLFVVGVLTEVETVGEDVLRARVVDPTGAFVLYAGQYQPDEQAFLEQAEPPMFVAVTGKARTFEPEDSDEVYSSVRPESINEVDAATRDRWTVQAAEQTLVRVDTMATALTTGLTGDVLAEKLRDQGVDEGLAAGVPLAIDHYGTTPRYLAALREMAVDATRVVAGERDEIDGLSARPDASGDETAEELAGTASDIDASPAEAGAVGTDAETGDAPGGAGRETESVVGTAGTEDADTGPDEADTEAPEAKSETDEPTGTTTTGDTGGGVATGRVETAEAETAEETDDDLGDFEPGEFDLDEETREQVEAEYGTEFQSGTEVEEPGDATIQTPDAEGVDTPATGTNAEGTGTAEATGSDQGTVDADSGTEPEDLEATLLEVMAELDDGEGADRDALLSTMAERYGLDEDEVEDAIDEALMGGQCYEPDDTSLKPI
ncbi:MAG: hypothetical protein V5A55_03080 [Halovenus sp.]